MITFQSENIAFPPIKKNDTKRWIKSVASTHGKKIGAVNYLFCTDEKILEVNNHYLQHDFYTDIITFDYSEKDTLSGDIFISLDTVRSNSQKYQTEYIDELRRVIIHGVLHLCGIKDKSAAEANITRAAEDEAIQLLNK